MQANPQSNRSPTCSYNEVTFLLLRGPELVSAGLDTLNYIIKLTNCTSFIRNQTIAGNSYDFEARCDSVTYRKFMMHILCVG